MEVNSGSAVKRSFAVVALVIVLFAFALTFSCAEDPAAEDFARAEKLYEKGRYRAAAEGNKGFRSIATEYPESSLAPKALYRSGTIYSLYLKEYEKAIEDFAYLIYYYPKHELAFDAQVEIVNIYMDRLENYGQAIIELRKLIEKYPNRKELDKYQYLLAQCFAYKRDFDQARLEYLILLDSYPNTELKPDIYYNIANTYFIEGSGKIDKAIEYYQRLLDEYPDSPYVLEAKFNIAASMEEKGELEEALKRYEELVGVYENDNVLTMRINGVRELMKKIKAPASEEAYRGFSPMKEKSDEGDEDEDEVDEVMEGEEENGDIEIIDSGDSTKKDEFKDSVKEDKTKGSGEGKVKEEGKETK
jgi:TolA-binding protein